MLDFSSFSEQLEQAVRFTVPYFLMLVLFFMNIVAVSYPLSDLIKAPLFLMGVFYWAIYRPSLMPAWFVFFAGCILDLLSGLPIGLNAFIFVFSQWIVTDQRRFLMGQNFLMIWIGFSLLSLIVVFFQWILFGLINFHWLALSPVLVSSFLVSTLFPFIFFLLHLTHRALPAPDLSIHFSSQR